MNLCKDNTRSLSLDYIRILAILFVIMIHTTSDFIEFDTSSSSYLWGNIFDSMSRAGVPLFVMVSGALMLDEGKNITIKKIFSKYILNILFLFIIWSCFYAFVHSAKNIFEGKTVKISRIIEQVVSGEFHMWYLIMIIELYIIVPILKLFVKKDKAIYIKYLITISLFSFLPVLFSSLSESCGVFEALSRQIRRFEYEFLGVFPTYFITGWYIKNIGIKHTKIVYLMSVFSLIIIILLVQLTGKSGGAYSNSNILVYLYSLGIFTFINRVCENKSGTEITKNLSNLTFGIYIIHVFVLNVINILYKPVDITPLSIFVKFSLTSVISFIVTYIISKIPGLRKLVRF